MMNFVLLVLNRLFNKFGYQLFFHKKRPEFNLEYSSEIANAIMIVKKNTMLSDIRLATLYEQAIYMEKNDIEGAFVECGVWKGGAVGMMALANLRFGKRKRQIHLFDAFDDICEPIPEIDGEVALGDIEGLLGRKVSPIEYNGRAQPIKGIYESRGGFGTIETCKDLIVSKIGYDENFLHFHKGWFQNILPQRNDAIQKIAILRLDADWYASTKVCLEFLFDKVVPGGFVIIDDYGRYDGCKLAVDEFLAKNKIKVFLNYSDYSTGECRYIIKN